MATDDKDKDQTEESGPQSKYKLVGAKRPGERVDRLILEGTSSNPTRYIDLHGEGVMTDAEAEVARREHGVVLRKVGEADDSNDDDAPSVDTKSEQQEAQRATAGAPASTGVVSKPSPGAKR